jgi:carbon storage regulator
MLILTRRVDESIRIAPNITITVLEVKGKQVRIGLSAPKHIAIVRTKLLSSKESS